MAEFRAPTGAGRLALLAYGVLPQALPQLVTFLLYRWEVIIRASVVVGFITGAGLGYQLRLDLSFRDWTDLELVLACYVLLVWGSTPSPGCCAGSPGRARGRALLSLPARRAARPRPDARGPGRPARGAARPAR